MDTEEVSGSGDANIRHYLCIRRKYATPRINLVYAGLVPSPESNRTFSNTSRYLYSCPHSYSSQSKKYCIQDYVMDIQGKV